MNSLIITLLLNTTQALPPVVINQPVVTEEKPACAGDE
jgi:hypothetical protein